MTTPWDYERNPIIIADAAALAGMALAIHPDRLQGSQLMLVDVLAVESEGSTAFDWFQRANGTIIWTIYGMLLDDYRNGRMTLKTQLTYEQSYPRRFHQALRWYVESLEQADIDSATVIYADPNVPQLLVAAEVATRPFKVEQFALINSIST